MSPAPQSPKDLSERQLRFGLWFVAHRRFLRKILIGVLLAIGVGSWAFTTWGLLRHFILERAASRQLIAELAQRDRPVVEVIERQRPQPLKVEEVVLLPNGAGGYDIAARIVNENSRSLATVEAELAVPGAPAEIARAVMLPGRDRWLTRLNVKSDASPTEATVVVRQLRWQRLRHEEFPDVEAYIRDRLNVEVRDAVYLPPRELRLEPGPPGTSLGAIGDPPQVSRATFTVENRSAYGLRGLELVVLLRRGDVIVGMNRVVLDALRAGESHPVAATWFHPIGLVTGVEVHPTVDVFDPRSFLSL